MKKFLTLSYTTTLTTVGLVGLLFLATLLPIPGNVKLKVVKSGSMEPAIHVGSIVALRPASAYEVGDVITFGEDTKTQIPTTHRIVKVEGSGSDVRFTTKGDANDTADPATTPLSKVEGKVFLTVPYLGYALAFARTKLGFFLLVGLPALAVFIEEGFSIYREAAGLRRRRRRANVRQPATQPEQPREPSARPDTRRLIRTIAFLGVISCVAGGGAYGSTLAYYANSATSHGNSMKAGVFDPPAMIASFVQNLEVLLSDPVVTIDAPSSDSLTLEATSTSASEAAAAADTTATVEAEAPSEPTVEITSGEATIQESVAEPEESSSTPADTEEPSS